jgi:hypothetical protein
MLCLVLINYKLIQMKMRKFMLTFVISGSLFFNLNNGFSQSMPEARNTIYFSCGMFPPMVTFGLNYERMISPNASIKTGINLCIASSSAYNSKDDYFLIFPVTVNYLTSGNNKFEVGAGIGPLFNISALREKIFYIKPAGSIGYQYQLESKSMFFKTGLEFPAVPIFHFGGIGYHF